MRGYQVSVVTSIAFVADTLETFGQANTSVSLHAISWLLS
jgi:hypothetical protein